MPGDVVLGRDGGLLVSFRRPDGSWTRLSKLDDKIVEILNIWTRAPQLDEWERMVERMAVTAARDCLRDSRTLSCSRHLVTPSSRDSASPGSSRTFLASSTASSPLPNGRIGASTRNGWGETR